MPVNEFGQPVGEPLVWQPGEPLAPVTLVGRTCRLVPLEPAHVDDLFTALCERSSPSTWTYIAAGPFSDRAGLAAYVEGQLRAPATVALTVLLPDGRPVGIATWLRIDHAMGTAEVGGIVLGSELQRTTAATEALSLMMAHAFEVARVRRYEWKCDALNAPSRRAAERLGFTLEGVFRQVVHYKGRNRDTAWFSITDREWPAVRAAHEAWLDPANFDDEGRQRTPLAVLREDPERG
ncbi:MAG: acetyltransferase, ribosomal protein N-acetylase [Marmoricola sp.]|nr:acetyltransferase, ribosomal protein N-acetylase [Marmoricola sp.]